MTEPDGRLVTPPDDWWQGDPRWATGRIVHDPSVRTMAAWTLAVLFSLATAAAVAVRLLPLRRSGEPPPLWFVVATAGLGLVTLAIAIVQSSRGTRYGRSELTLDPFPARPGEPLDATVRLPNARATLRSVRMTLECVHRFRRNVRQGGTIERSIWRAERLVEPTEEGRTLRARYELPEDATLVDEDPGDVGIIWRLSADEGRPGIGYSAAFELPVVRRRKPRIPLIRRDA